MSPSRHLPLLLLLFVGSGCAALIYQIVWFQLLQLVIGSSAVSLGVVLGTFMGGMCLGSFLLPRLVSPHVHPLKVYALLEFGIAVFGLLVLYLIPFVGEIYTIFGGQGWVSVLLRGLLCAICLLPPTLLMGATLPAISRWVESTPRGIAWLGYFYGGNTAGAVFGCLLAGFYLLRVLDMPMATYVAVLVNVAVAAIGFGLAAETRHEVRPAAAVSTDIPGRTSRLILVAIALSGFTALGAEVVWTRLLSLLLGGSTYTFSIILGVFLIGIGLGSSAASYVARNLVRPRVALGLTQLMLAVWIAWTAYVNTHSLPYWPVMPALSTSPWVMFQLDFVRAAFAILPAACLWGASFPLALAAAATTAEDTGRTVGRVYAANTVGAIAGAVFFSTLAVPLLGTDKSQRLLIIVAAIAGLALLLPARNWQRTLATLAGVGGVAALLAFSVAPVPFELIAYGRQTAGRFGSVVELYRGEGINSSIAVSESVRAPGVRYFHVAGKVEASNTPQDMRLQLLLGNLPALVHPDPESILVVGFGAGVTAGSFVPYPEMKRMVICEMEPLVPQATSVHFARENQNVFHDPRVQTVFDDGRHFMRTTDEKFDIITSDPINPWVKGAATLYTREYFEQVKARLKPGGVVTQWVPLYESSEEAVKSEIATFFEVFPDGTVWGNLKGGKGYDVVLLGTVGPTQVDLDAVEARLSQPSHERVVAALAQVGFASATDLFATFAGTAGDIVQWTSNAQINHDRNLRLQYIAGMASNAYLNDEIYRRIVSMRGSADAIFIGSEARRQAVLRAVGSPE